MRSLLVTGGAGFIGGNFVHYWLENHPDDRLVVLDALTYASNVHTLDIPKATGRMTFIHGDILDVDLVTRLMSVHEIDTIVHFAAESHVDRSIVASAGFVRTNVLGTQVLLDVARRQWCPGSQWKPNVRFHHISTDEVYGSLGPTDPAFTERTPYAPNSPYAASKAGADHLVRAYRHTYGLPATISNCSNNYGPYQFPEKLIPLTIVNALHGRSLPIYGDGRQVRDWLYVADHCLAIDQILQAETEIPAFNIGGKAERKNLDIVREICGLVDQRFDADPALSLRFPDCPAAMRGERCSSLITHVRDRLGHDRRYAIDPALAETTLGFVPRERLSSGLERTVDWYLANESWWRSALDDRGLGG